MRTVDSIEAFARKLTAKIDDDYETGNDEGTSDYWNGIYQGRLEGLRWALDQIDFTDRGHVVKRTDA
jgi:hypothetical protein